MEKKNINIYSFLENLTDKLLTELKTKGFEKSKQENSKSRDDEDAVERIDQMLIEMNQRKQDEEGKEKEEGLEKSAFQEKKEGAPPNRKGSLLSQRSRNSMKKPTERKTRIMNLAIEEVIK